MTITSWRRLAYGAGADGGEFELWAYWDDKGYDDNGQNPTDPNADMLVRGIRYKNTTAAVVKAQRLDEATQTWVVIAEAPPGTPLTTFDPIPRGQRPSIEGNWMFG